jgi:dihydrofolate reductase
MTISLIAAVAQNRAIGKDNQLLWHLPEDMRHFRETTRGKTVIMGRKTWESLPEKFRPLPGRRNIVVTRDRNFVAEGAELAHSLDEAIAAAGDDGETFVIGGAELYRQALPMAQRLYLTEVAQAYEGDVFFPEIQTAEWQEISRMQQCSNSGMEFAFVIYQHR